jgi:hypothetical protein
MFIGVGGSNAHVVLDDALHFLRSYHVVGRHRTVLTPKVPDFLSLPYVNGISFSHCGLSSPNDVHRSQR